MRIKKKSRLMIREWSLALLGLSTLALSIAVPHKASAISLKQNSIVEGNTITLGDIFTGLEAGSDPARVLGMAPPPGNDMVLNSYTLMRIAVALDLPWRPSSNTEQVVLKRAATVIEPSMIKDTINAGLTEQDLPGKYTVSFASEPAKIILPKDEAQTLEIVSLNVKPDQNSFEAVIAAPSKAHAIETVTVNGQLQRIVEVPVLKTSFQSGQVISDGDIEFIEVRAEAVNADTVLKTESLIGMTPRRAIISGKAVKLNDLMAPQVIARGELVTMIFSNNGLNLTAKGKAMQNGAKGETIRVVNASSNKTIEGIVTGDSEITVQSF
jgi:flagella basal body P-ring formation protein FlgA